MSGNLKGANAAYAHAVAKNFSAIFLFNGVNEDNVAEILQHEYIHKTLYDLGLKRACVAFDGYVPYTVIVPFTFLISSFLEAEPVDVPPEELFSQRQKIVSYVTVRQNRKGTVLHDKDGSEFPCIIL